VYKVSGLSSGIARQRKMEVIMRTSIRMLFICICISTQTIWGRDTTTLSTQQWREDLRFMVEKIKDLHPDPFFKIADSTFHEEVDALYENIPHLTRNETLVRLLRIPALIGDWHTRLISPHLTTGWFPVRIEQFSDGLFITAVSSKYAHAYGTKVLQIGNLKADEAFEKIQYITSSDNAYSRVYFAPLFLMMSSVMNGLHIIENEQTLHLLVEDENGKRTEINIEAETFDSDQFYSWYWLQHAVPTDDYISVFSHHPEDLPLYLQHFDSPYWFEYLEDYQTVYMCFNQCTNDESESFSDFNKKLWAFIETNPVQRLIIDMRNNLGGTNSYLEPLIHGVIKHDQINKKGHLFVITGRKNISAAVHCIAWLEKHCDPVFAGEPTGAPPNHYADPEVIRLPNSQFNLMVSKWYWMNTRYPWDERTSIEPHIQHEIRSDEYFYHKDPVLTKIFEYIEHR
jgi:hypothetical protein